MSHEIRTPLSGILGNVGVMGNSDFLKGSVNFLAETSLNLEQQDLLHTTQVCGEQLLYLINDILGNVTSIL